MIHDRQNSLSGLAGGLKSPYSGISILTSYTDYCQETRILIDRSSQFPPNGLANLIDVTMRGLIFDGVHKLADCFYIRGVHESQLATQNWAKDAHNSTLVNNPRFVPKVGFTGATGKYIKNNFIPASDGVNFKLSDASFFVITKELPATGMNACYMIGAITPAGVDLAKQIYLRYYEAANERFSLNYNSYSQTYINMDVDDFVGVTRDATKAYHYKNGNYLDDSNQNETGLPLSGMAELGYSSSGTYVADYFGNIFFSFYGARLNATQVLALYTRIKYFNDNVNAAF